MRFKKALVPSALAVAGITAAIFQPSSLASPQDEHSEVAVSSTHPGKPDVDEKDRDTKDAKDRDTKDAKDKDRDTKDAKDKERDSKNTDTRDEKDTDAKDRDTKERDEKDTETTQPTPNTTAKKTTGTIKQATSNTLRDGTTPKKLDLNKFKITPEPEPTPEPQQNTPQPEPQQPTQQEPQPAPAPAPYNANTGNAVVDAALAQVGTPYVWGGSQPGGFDCSGLTSWAYAQAGKTIPRTSGAQWAGGQAISPENMQPGDIVVSYGGGHVGIYIGDGQMVHAPTSGDVVKVSPLQPIDGVVRF